MHASASESPRVIPWFHSAVSAEAQWLLHVSSDNLVPWNCDIGQKLPIDHTRAWLSWESLTWGTRNWESRISWQTSARVPIPFGKRALASRTKHNMFTCAGRFGISKKWSLAFAEDFPAPTFLRTLPIWWQTYRVARTTTIQIQYYSLI